MEKNIQSFIEQNAQDMQLILALNKATQEYPDLAGKLENAKNEQEVSNLIKEYVGTEYTAAQIIKASNTSEQFVNLLNTGHIADELKEEALDSVVGGLSFKGFWKRTGLAFKIAAEALLMVSFANPKAKVSMDARVRAWEHLKSDIKKDVKRLKNTK